MKKSAVALAVGVVALAATGFWAVAQQADRTEADALQADLEEKALTRPRD